MKILRKKEEADKEIKRIQASKQKLKKESENYEKYKKAQVHIEDLTEEERKKQTTLYKTIMCPLG